jgi:UDP-N-acetylglucosamine 2-epimerase
MKILHVVGARPNFMKVSPVHRAIAAYPKIQQILIHTGQHYDLNMSDIFFKQLALPAPDVNLGVGSGSHAVQTAQIMIRFEEAVLKENPDLVLVYGDINSTVASALVCTKLGIPVDMWRQGFALLTALCLKKPIGCLQIRLRIICSLHRAMPIITFVGREWLNKRFILSAM